jgi:hypothetical protein
MAVFWPFIQFFLWRSIEGKTKKCRFRKKRSLSKLRAEPHKT